MVPPAAAGVGRLDKAACEDAIATVLLSLCLVMAGTGHLPTFRLVQLLSRRVPAPPARPLQQPGADGQPAGTASAALLGGPGVGAGSLHYGHHLAVSLAGGLLFLSGGRSSLSTSNEAIAALLIALYPVWPSSPTDQRCHLQVGGHGSAPLPLLCVASR
jgi:anaphase-promoting complex subunit 1